MAFILSPPPLNDREFIKHNIIKLELGLTIETSFFHYRVSNGSLIGHVPHQEHQIFWDWKKFLENDFVHAV